LSLDPLSPFDQIPLHVAHGGDRPSEAPGAEAQEVAQQAPQARRLDRLLGGRRVAAPGRRWFGGRPSSDPPPAAATVLAGVAHGCITRRTGRPLTFSSGKNTWWVRGSTATVWARVARRPSPSLW